MASKYPLPDPGVGTASARERREASCAGRSEAGWSKTRLCRERDFQVSGKVRGSQARERACEAH